MENAVKALLIAAAVIIAVVLITLAMGLFNSASEQTPTGDLSEYEIQKFNDKFIIYEGNNVSGNQVNVMIKTVLNHNLAQEDSSTCVAVNVEDKTGTSLVIDASQNAPTSDGNAPEKVVPTNKYIVFCIYDKNSHLVNNIIVKDKSLEK